MSKKKRFIKKREWKTKQPNWISFWQQCTICLSIWFIMFAKMEWVIGWKIRLFMVLLMGAIYYLINGKYPYSKVYYEEEFK